MTLRRASPACASCRTRRIKCNLLRPRCSQCARAGLDCSGYRSQSELLFRDQTKSIIHKAQHPDSKTVSINHSTTHLSSLMKPTFNMDELAQKVFTDNFPVLGAGCQSWMESGAEEPSSTTISLTSVGLAAIALVHKDPQMMHLARRKYNSAIKALTSAIARHGEIGVEQSIAASFILSMFEMMTRDNLSTSDGWSKHVLGAATFLGYLCSANGLPESPVTEIVDICFNTTLACIVSDKVVPTILLELPDRFELSSTTLKDDEQPLLLAMRLFAIMGALVNLRNFSNRGAILPSQAIAFASQSSRTLQGWTESLPTAWGRINNAEQDYAVYRNIWLARIWNYYRLARILANQIIIENFDKSLLEILSAEGTTTNQFSEHREYLFNDNFCMSQEIYGTFPSMFDSEHTSSASLPLSATFFFITSILQSLLKITDRTALFRDWSIPATEALGERFTVTKEVVTQNLQ